MKKSKSTYSGRPFPVSILASLQKSPLFYLETVSPSSCEATMKARAPRPNRRGQLRCTTSPPRVDGVLGSYAGARGLCIGRARDVLCGKIHLQHMSPVSSISSPIPIGPSSAPATSILVAGVARDVCVVVGKEEQ